MRAGKDHQVIFQDVDEHIAFVRVRFGGGAPTLPVPRPKASTPGEDDWLCTDPEGPEWGA